MQTLATLVYGSTQTAPLTPTALNLLVQRARIRNKQLDITGALLYDGVRFMQCLEGPEPAVAEIYSLICDDTRHADVSTLLRHSVTERAFADWQMGFVSIFSQDRAQALKRLGLADPAAPANPARALLLGFFAAAAPGSAT
jgi:hypothetical protein